MGEMIGNIAHQWRQPLNALIILIQSFQTKMMFGKLDEKFVEEQVEEGLKLANSMSKTIDDFRTFFKPKTEKKVIDLCQSIKNTLSLIGIIIKNEQININIKCDKNVELISYENALNQVILNLFSNSKDAFVSNSVKNRKIDITILKTKLKNCIIFKDNGGGIDESIIGRIFEPYFPPNTIKPHKGQVSDFICQNRLLKINWVEK
jgi:signal transduction histidine kinase